jgi:nucleoside-diphosphate-sugar epimerase
MSNHLDLILVTGAGGFIGGNLVGDLRAGLQEDQGGGQ